MSKKIDPVTLQVQAALTRALTEAESYPTNSKEFADIITQVTALHKIKADKPQPRVSVDTMVTVGANLLGIVAILSFEQTRVIATKALGFVAKAKI